MSDRIERARQRAVEAHGEARYGGAPYVTHLDAVAAIVQAAGGSEDAVVAAFLHDAVEDTGLRLDAIVSEFGAAAARMVAFCSDEPGATRKARKSATYARMQRDLSSLAEQPAEARAVLLEAVLVKLADRLANARASKAGNAGLLEMYRDEHPSFREALAGARVHPELWRELDALLGEG